METKATKRNMIIHGNDISEQANMNINLFKFLKEAMITLFSMFNLFAIL